MPTEEKLSRLLRKELNPFVYGNFNDESIAHAKEDLAMEWKHMALPNMFLNKSQMR